MLLGVEDHRLRDALFEPTPGSLRFSSPKAKHLQLEGMLLCLRYVMLHVLKNGFFVSLVFCWLYTRTV